MKHYSYATGVTGFHIHVEGDGLSDEARGALAVSLKDLGFNKDDFLRKQDIAAIHATSGLVRLHSLALLTQTAPPNDHWTWKAMRNEHPDAHYVFVEIRKQVADLIAGEWQVLGIPRLYMEAECIEELTVPDGAAKPFNPDIAPPHVFTKGDKKEKGSDLHISFGEDVDPLLIKTLTGIGFYLVLRPDKRKPGQAKFVLTAQGTVQQIDELISETFDYLHRAGGGGRSVKAKKEIVNDIERGNENVMIADVMDPAEAINPTNL